ncbi:DNA-binding protein [Streptomyces sp. enrichment culture]|uniref:DNA-binding protein n=1 Tax=Streptomyces sp. enrichment culture TaxID=1795815 RepID=UPI003F55B0F3
MTTTTAITPLPPALLRVAEHLVAGAAPRDIAAETCLSPETIRHYLRQLREHLGCPPRSKQQVVVHALFAFGHLTPPPAGRPAPELSAPERRLLKAAAENSTIASIAAASRIPSVYLPSALNALLARTGTRNVTQLIVLAHAWRLLPTARNRTAPAGTPR